MFLGPPPYPAAGSATESCTEFTLLVDLSFFNHELKTFTVLRMIDERIPSIEVSQTLHNAKNASVTIFVLPVH